MNRFSKFNFFRFYNFLLAIAFCVFSILFVAYLINSFYTAKPKRVNDPKLLSLAWNEDNFKIRQNVVYQDSSYRTMRQLLVKNVSYISSLEREGPKGILKKDKKTEVAVYYSLSNTILINVNDAQIASLKIMLGLAKCFFILIILIVIYQVWQMLKSVEKNNYLVARNAQRIQFIGFLCFVIPLNQRLVDYLLMTYLIKNFDLQGLKFTKTDFDFSIWLWIVGGILCAVLAYIISKGNEIKQENDLTI